MTGKLEALCRLVSSPLVTFIEIESSGLGRLMVIRLVDGGAV